MYDKVTLFIPRVRDTPDILNTLDNAREVVKRETGEVSMYGSLNGLKVRVLNMGIIITGSLAKYMYNDNIHTLDRKATQDALLRLSENLHMDATEAQVWTIEFGTQFPMKNAPSMYLNELGDMAFMKRCQVESDSLYYNQRCKSLAFYDKIKDAKKKGIQVPMGISPNSLRYELRLNKRLGSQLHLPNVTASNLYNRDVYRAITKMWQRNYFAINKKKQILDTDMIKEIKTVKDGRKAWLALASLAYLKEQPDGIERFIDKLKAAGAYSDRKYYSRLKKELHDISDAKAKNERNELIKELDDAVKNAGKYV